LRLRRRSAQAPNATDPEDPALQQAHRCSHSIAISADRWPDDVRLSDLEARFACKACGKRGADVRPLGAPEAETRSAMTVWIYVDTSKQVGDRNHLKVFAREDAVETWLEENDPKGVAFEYEVLE
jgi:hypothetical protein